MNAHPIRVKPVFTRLADFRRSEVSLVNWFANSFPGVEDWERWLGEVFGLLLHRPERRTVTLVRTNLIDAAAKPERHTVDRPEFSLGRDEDNEIVLAEATITKRHARLLWNGTTLRVEDLISTMGTLVNGRKLRSGDSRPLFDGDHFVIFPYRFDVEIRREWAETGPAALFVTPALPMSWSEFQAQLPAAFDPFAIQVEPAGEACLVFEAAFLRGLVERMLLLSDAAALFTAADEGLLELLLVAAIERANRDMAWPFRFSLGRRGSAPGLQSSDRGLSCVAVVQSGTLSGKVHAFLPFALIERSRELWKPPAAAGALAQTRLPFAVSLGYVDLTSEEHQLIEPGDVVFHEACACLLWPGHDDCGWNVTRTADNRFEVTSLLKKDLIMTQDAPLNFAELPLRVQVIFGEYEMSLSDAQTLGAGAIVDLDRDPAAPVKLAVQGRLAGTGELVDIDGRIGVRIIEWNRR